MELTLLCKIIIGVTAVIGGYPIVGILMLAMRCHVDWFMRKVADELLGLRKVRKVAYSFGATDLYVGIAERFVAIVLTVWCIPSLPAFIGGWIALKFAVNWKRRERKNKGGDARQS